MPSKVCWRLTVPPLPSRYLNSICSSPLPNSTRSLIFSRQAFERRLDVELGVPRQRLNQLKVVGVAPVPAAHRAAGQRQMRIGDDLLGIEELLSAEAVAARAGADRTVEGEQPRLELGQGVVADRAGEFVREHQLGALRVVHVGDPRHALAQPQGGLEGFGQPLAQIGPHLEAIDDRLDRVLAAHVELGRLVELHHLAVDAGAHETARLQLLDELGVLALALGDRGCEQHQGGALPDARARHRPSGSPSGRRDRCDDRGSAACRRGRTAAADSRRSR